MTELMSKDLRRTPAKSWCVSWAPVTRPAGLRPHAVSLCVSSGPVFLLSSRSVLRLWDLFIHTARAYGAPAMCQDCARCWGDSS